VRRFIAAVALGVVGCAADTLVYDAPKSMQDVAIAPFEIQEECARLVPGDRLDYRFEAKAPVAFSIYYQEGTAFLSPVSRDDVTESSGVFKAQIAHRYCLRWEAGQQGALLDYRIRLLRANAP
jgi:hypothetical protein